MTDYILGVDVSHWQTGVSWNFAKSQGVQYAFAKGMEYYYTDRQFLNHWTSSRGIMPRGAYLYYRDTLVPQTQARKFHELLASTGDLGEVPPALDLEGYNNPQLTASKIKICLEELAQLFGRNPLVYSRKDILDRWLGSPGWLPQYPLWQAQYTLAGWHTNHFEKVKLFPPVLPKAYAERYVWQFSDKCPAALLGVSGSATVDVNYAEPDKLALLIGQSPPPPEGDPMKNGKCIADLVNIRNIHAKAGSVDGGDLLKNDTFKFYPLDTWTKADNTEIWWHIKTDKLLSGSPVVGWAAYKHPDFSGIGGYGLQEIA